MSGDGKYGRPSGRDTVENLYARVGQLELDIRRLKDTKRAALDRGATASVPTPYEGQTIIQDTDLYYYAESAWHTPGGASGISALGVAGSRSQTMSGLTLDFMFDAIVTNDASFGYEQVTSSRAQFITISSEGWYHGRFVVFFDSDFTAGDFPFIQPTCFISGVQDVLVNSAIWSLSDERNIANNQSATGELDRHVLSCALYFNFTAADFGDSVVGIGMRILANANRTKSFGGQLELTRLGDAVTQLTIT